jgi:hypothetical protein
MMVRVVAGFHALPLLFRLASLHDPDARPIAKARLGNRWSSAPHGPTGNHQWKNRTRRPAR